MRTSSIAPPCPDGDDEKKAVAQADVVIVAVGFNPKTEGGPRPHLRPSRRSGRARGQVVAANPRTIVLTGGGGMDVSHWLDKVPALLHLYYPGQEGGTAVAQILFGQHNPEGKLSVSFDRSWEDKPLRQVVPR